MTAKKIQKAVVWTGCVVGIIGMTLSGGIIGFVVSVLLCSLITNNMDKE